ncbi:arabinosyltransferase [Sesbania bispinosa]|nr:arabinosyltransferase [Sesbania bispinosa]
MTGDKNFRCGAATAARRSVLLQLLSRTARTAHSCCLCVEIDNGWQHWDGGGASKGTTITVIWG